MITVKAAEVFQSALERQFGLESYKWIMDKFWRVDVSKDVDFQHMFVSFYRVRRNENFRCKYFSKMQDIKGRDAEFKMILKEILDETGYFEPSFTSKMLATQNPDLPIWDKFVLNHFGLKPTGKDKVESAANLYLNLCEQYANYLITDEAKENIEIFDQAFSNYKDISDIKKIDFLIWADR